MIQLLPGEEIKIIRKRHWLPFVTQTASLVLAALLPVFLFAAESFLPYSLQQTIRSFETFPIFLWIAWVLFLWIFFGVSWTNYYLDTLIITNKRIIDIDQIGLFSRDVAEVRIEKVEDVRVEILGFIASMLHYGNIHIQTAGESREFIIRDIHNPHQLREVIANAAETLPPHP